MRGSRQWQFIGPVFGKLTCLLEVTAREAMLAKKPFFSQLRDAGLLHAPEDISDANRRVDEGPEGEIFGENDEVFHV